MTLHPWDRRMLQVIGTLTGAALGLVLLGLVLSRG